MSKRYVFWRSPTGQPHQSADGRFAPTELLASVSKSTSVRADGGISWPDFDFMLSEPVILSLAAVVGPDGLEVDDTTASSIIRKGIYAAIRKSGGGVVVKPDDVLREANKEAADHFRRPFADFVLLSALSVKEFPATRIRVGRCEVSPLVKDNYYTPPKALKTALTYSSLEDHLNDNRGHLVRVAVQGRTPFEAADRGIDALYLLRGYWTLFGTYGSWSVSGGSFLSKKPVGVIRTGPFHTLHYPDGTSAYDAYWYESHFSEEQKLYTPKNGWEKIEKMRRWAMRRLKASNYARDVEELIMRFSSALDHSDHDVAFLQLWSVIEKITATVGANYDETIKRATWGFDEPAYHRQLLEALRVRRNRYVHAARSGQGGEQSVYLSKLVIEPHLLRLIRNDFGVTSLAEYGDFLSLPTDPTLLRKRKERYSKAHKMLTRRKSP